MHAHALKYACPAFARGIGNWLKGKPRGGGGGGMHLSPGRTWPMCAAGVSELGKREARFTFFGDFPRRGR